MDVVQEDMQRVAVTEEDATAVVTTNRGSQKGGTATSFNCIIIVATVIYYDANCHQVQY